MCCLLSLSLSLPLGVCVCVRSFCHCHCLARGRGRGGEAEACREGGSTHANENTLRLAGDNGEATQKANLKQRFLLMAPRPSIHLPIYPSALWYVVSLPLSLGFFRFRWLFFLVAQHTPTFDTVLDLSLG